MLLFSNQAITIIFSLNINLTAVMKSSTALLFNYITVRCGSYNMHTRKGQFYVHMPFLAL